MNVTDHTNPTVIESSWHIDILTERRYRLYRHVFSLLVLFFFLFTAKIHGEFSGVYDIFAMMIPFGTMVVYYYTNMYILIPNFFYKKRPLKYFLVLSFMIGAGFIVSKILTILYLEPHRIIPPYNKQPLLLEFVFTIAVITPFLLASTALKLFQRWFADSNKINELETRALESELTALRNQINPHFLFNMLNNVNVLIKNDPVKASVVIVKLSDFLRYHLYENSGSMVLLTSEIKFIVDFINLEKLRRDHLTVVVKQDPMYYKGITVPPNVFITFIENAIKHSADSIAPSEIHISFTIIENRLEFICVNTKPERKRIPVSNGGLGLANITRRLDLMFQKDYTLAIEDSQAEYKMTLTIPV